MIDLREIEKRCDELDVMNDPVKSPDLDSFDQELVCNLADDVRPLLDWVKRAKEVIEEDAYFTESGIEHMRTEHARHMARERVKHLRQLLAELGDTGGE